MPNASTRAPHVYEFARMRVSTRVINACPVRVCRVSWIMTKRSRFSTVVSTTKLSVYVFMKTMNIKFKTAKRQC